MAHDSVNKIDSRMLKGIDDTKDEKLRELNFNSDETTQRAEAGMLLSLYGEYFKAMINVGGKPMTYSFQIVDKKVRPGKINEITVKTLNTTKDKYGKSHQVLMRWYFDDDKRLVRETFWYDGIAPNQNKVEWKKPVVYPKNFDTIPGEIIRNTPTATPDWEIVGGVLYELNAISNDIGPESELWRTLFRSVGVFGTGQDAETKIKKIMDGDLKTLSESSKNGQFQSQYDVLMSGSPVSQALLNQTMYLEDRAMKYGMFGRDSDSSGANKHNLQVGLFNQVASEQIQKKKEQRERDLMRFYKNVIEKYTDIVITAKYIKFDSTEFEEGIKEGLRKAKSERLALEAQSKQQKAYASKLIEEAKVVDQKDATLVVANAEESKPN